MMGGGGDTKEREPAVQLGSRHDGGWSSLVSFLAAGVGNRSCRSCRPLFLEIILMELLDLFVGSFNDIAQHTFIALHSSCRSAGIVQASDVEIKHVLGLVRVYLLIFGDFQIGHEYLLHLDWSVRGADVGVTGTTTSTDTDTTSATTAGIATQNLGHRWRRGAPS